MVAIKLLTIIALISRTYSCVYTDVVSMDTVSSETISLETVGMVDPTESSGLGSSPTLSPSRSAEEAGGDENSKLVWVVEYTDKVLIRVLQNHEPVYLW